MNCRLSRRGRVAALLLSATLLLGIAAPVASAAPEAGPGWAFKASFGELSFFSFETPRSSVAVDSSDNVFVADQNLESLLIFAPTADGGEPLAEIRGSSPRNVAIDLSDDTVYVDQNFLGAPGVRRYLSDGQPTPTYTVDPTFEVTQGDGIAVDPATGNLLVADSGAEAVRRYDSSGTPLEALATPSINPAWIVAVPDGSFYVAPAEGPDITHFSATGTLLGTISGAGLLHGLTYDAARSAVVVAVGTKLKSYSPAGTLLAESPAQDESGLSIAVSSSGLLYEHAVSHLNLYAPAIAPGVEAPQASALTTHSAHLSAEVDPGEEPGGEAPAGSTAKFEYSDDGGQSWKEMAPQELTASGPTTIEANLTGLIGNFDYLVRVVAGNDAPISTTSAATLFHTLLTAPEVETGPAISVTETSAKLTGKIDTLGVQTTYHFEYGLTDSYGSKVPAGAEAIAGNERGARSFSRGISGLQPNTTYHYRLVANSSEGEGVGEDRTFTTSGAGAVRGYEQVSPREKLGGTIRSDLGFQAAPDGSAVAYQLGQAPADAASAVLFSRALSRRSSTGWLDWSLLDPPQKTVRSITTTVTHAISPDFTHTLVVSDRVLTPIGPNGPYEEGGNLYIQDLATGEYTFVGGAPGNLGGFSPYAQMTGIGSESIYMAGALDFSWLIISSQPPLLPGVAGRAVYRWTREGGLQVESLLPDNSIPTGEVAAPGLYERDTYRQASDDGSVVYFSLNNWEGGVYRRTGGQTIAISKDPGDPDTVMPGRFDGASSDGRYAFFRSFARLSNDAPDPDPSQPYLYRYDAQAGSLEFIGLVRDLGEGTVFGVGDSGQVVYYETASNGTEVWNNNVKNDFSTSRGPYGVQLFASPNGKFLAYFGTDKAIHLYDADAEEEVCVSCGAGDGGGELSPGNRTISNRHPEVVNNEGELYFDTRNPLLAEDHNATYDVYRYHDGLLTLISPGDGPFDAHFGDATPDGSDVFFTTSQALVPGDVDRSVDVYDARIGGGGFPETGTAAPECEGEACKPPIGRPPELERPKAGEASRTSFRIGKLKPLSSAERKKLARGGKAHLRLTVSRPGTVRVTGKKVKASSAKAKRAGALSVPFSLTKKALSELRGKGKLRVKLSLHFGDAHPKAVSFALNATANKKGGRS